MSSGAVERLAELARTDPTVAPLALLQAEVVRVSADPAWAEGLPPLERRQLDDRLPLLHGVALAVDPERQRDLLARLATVVGQSGQAEAEPFRRALTSGRLDPLALLEASINQDAAGLAELAAAGGVALDLLATLGQLASVPLLQAVGRQAAPLLEALIWEAGHCPVCAAWPTLAELRGLERKRWLRCGRCGASWWCYQQRCSFCATMDHRLHGYLAPEADRESRRVVTCDGCHSYLKTLTTLGPIPPEELSLQDLTSLELDLAAMEQGYGRPELPGFPLVATVEPAGRAALWLPWRR